MLVSGLYVCHRYSLQRLFGCITFLWMLFLGHQLAARPWETGAYDFSSRRCIYRVRVDGRPEEKERSILCPVRVWGVFAGDSLQADARRPAFLLYFHKDSASACLERGDELLVQTRLAPPRNWEGAGGFDYARYLRRHGVSGTGYVPAGCWRVTGHDPARTLRQIALDYREEVVEAYRRLGFQGDDWAVLCALTVGDQDDLSEDIVEAYSVAGASHVLSLSGLHIGFLYALLWLVFSPLWRRWHWVKPFLLALIVVCLWAFAFFTGLASPVVRSVVMISLVALASLQREKLQAIHALVVAGFLMLLVRPLWLFDVSFQLTFLSLAAILIFQPPLYACWKPRNRVVRYVWGLLTTSLAAQVGAAPLVALYFSRFSSHFLLSNLWVVPLSSLILYAALLLLALTPFPALQASFARVVEGLVGVQNEGLRWIARLPFASLEHLRVDVVEVCLFYVVCILCYVWWRRFTPRRVYVVLFILLAGALWHLFV